MDNKDKIIVNCALTKSGKKVIRIRQNDEQIFIKLDELSKKENYEILSEILEYLDFDKLTINSYKTKSNSTMLKISDDQIQLAIDQSFIEDNKHLLRLIKNTFIEYHNYLNKKFSDQEYGRYRNKIDNDPKYDENSNRLAGALGFLLLFINIFIFANFLGAEELNPGYLASYGYKASAIYLAVSAAIGVSVKNISYILNINHDIKKLNNEFSDALEKNEKTMDLISKLNSISTEIHKRDIQEAVLERISDKNFRETLSADIAKEKREKKDRTDIKKSDSTRRDDVTNKNIKNKNSRTEEIERLKRERKKFIEYFVVREDFEDENLKGKKK